MEFGERLKQAREKKGMTQQTLADRLFVTRQTVSRWENGVRYPDILTVRKLSEILEISLDDLLSQENPKQIVERSPILENRTAERLQTAVYMLAAVPYLFRVLGLLWESGIGTGYTPETAEVFWELPVTAICAAAILFGAGKSIAGQMTPKMVCAMTGIYFLAAVISRAISIFTWTDPEGELRVYASGGGTLLFLLILCFSISAVGAVFRFYMGKKPCSPRAVYITAALLAFYSILLFAGRMFFVYLSGRGFVDISFYDTLLRCFGNGSFALLMFFQARTFHRKQRLAQEE